MAQRHALICTYLAIDAEEEQPTGLWPSAIQETNAPKINAVIAREVSRQYSKLTYRMKTHTDFSLANRKSTHESRIAKAKRKDGNGAKKNRLTE